MNRNRKQITFSLHGSPPPGLIFKFQKLQQFFRIMGINKKKKEKSFHNQRFGSERRHGPHVSLKTNTGSTGGFSQPCKSRTFPTVWIQNFSFILQDEANVKFSFFEEKKKG